MNDQYWFELKLKTASIDAFYAELETFIANVHPGSINKAYDESGQPGN